MTAISLPRRLRMTPSTNSTIARNTIEPTRSPRRPRSRGCSEPVMIPSDTPGSVAKRIDERPSTSSSLSSARGIACAMNMPRMAKPRATSMPTMRGVSVDIGLLFHCSDGARCGAARLECRQPGIQFDLLVGGLERLELRIEAGRGELLSADHPGLLAADLVFEAADLARRVEQVDRLDGILHLALGIDGLRSRDQLVALGAELRELAAHRGQARLELVDDGGLRCDRRRGSGRLLLGRQLPAERDLREVVELVRVGRVAGRTQFVGLAARGDGLVAPVGRVRDILGVILFEQSQVADRLGDGALRL